MRLFIAVNFNDEIKNRLLSIQTGIKKQSLKGSFTRPENLHLTLIFLGETPPEKVQPVCSVMEKACLSCPPFSMNLSCTGFFKHSNKELWWIGADSEKSPVRCLEKLRQNLSDGLHAEGVKFDERPFKAHITLGREIKRNQPIELAKEIINISVNRISLMQSERINGLLVYSEIGCSDCKAPAIHLS